MSEGAHLAIVAGFWTIVVVALVLLALIRRRRAAWTRKPLPGLIVAAWLSLGPIFMPYADNNLRDGRTGVVAGMAAELAANGVALLGGIAAYREHRRRQQPLPAPATEPGPR
jgi:hypothetical protein